MPRYNNSYLSADKHLQESGVGPLYDFLMARYRAGSSYNEVVFDLHDVGYDVSHESVRNWYLLLIQHDSDERVGAA